LHIRTSSNGHKIIDIEDPTGTIRVLFIKNEIRELMNQDAAFFWMR